MGLFRSEENIDFGQFADTTCVQNDIDTLLGDALPRLNLNWIYQWARYGDESLISTGGMFRTEEGFDSNSVHLCARDETG